MNEIKALHSIQIMLSSLIENFQSKITDFFDYVRNEDKDGKRFVVKINSQSSESEIIDDFSKIYRRYKALKRKIVGDYFFKETESLVEKLSADFEEPIRGAALMNEQEVL